MLVSLNWLRDFVDLPADLDPRQLADRFTMTTAEVEGVEHIHVACEGLRVAEVTSVSPIPGTADLHEVQLRLPEGGAAVVSSAAGLSPGCRIVFAPTGALLPGVGRISKTEAAGLPSAGLIVPGEAIGLAQAAQQAVFLPPDTPPGQPIGAAGLLDDWVMEVDNKSITHRPDLWGHYGIARELAAIYHVPLKPLPVDSLETMSRRDLPEIPILIDDPRACPRYSGIRFTGVRHQPSPLWMQARLSHVGIRPIDLAVDLTNYVMAELGQPLHAFDGDLVRGIEVGLTRQGDKFTTLDGVQRTLPAGALMIMSNRKPVALAGIMGGLHTEVTAKTTSILVESANFDGAAIRRAAAALGHRTEAGARFEKSLDPEITVLAIGRLIHLARSEWPQLRLTSRLSDCYPAPAPPVWVDLDLEFLNRFLGKAVGVQEVTAILSALGFEVLPTVGGVRARVPSFRAGRDIQMEADVIEEVARFVGYDTITPVLPQVALRNFEPYALRMLERRTLHLLCESLGFMEVHDYVWFDGQWLAQLGFDPGPCVTLRNPAAAGQERLVTTLVPGLLAKVERNRHHFASFRLTEVAAVFEPDPGGDRQFRHLGLLLVARGAKAEDQLMAEAKSALDLWGRQVVGRAVHLGEAAGEPLRPWEHPQKRLEVRIDGLPVGSLTAVPLDCRLRIDEHLARWSLLVAEVRLDPLAELPPVVRPLPAVPAHPRIELDFSILAPLTLRYRAITEILATFRHPLLRRLWFVGGYEGGALPEGTRSLTYRASIGSDSATLTDEDSRSFQDGFLDFLKSHQLQLRA